MKKSTEDKFNSLRLAINHTDAPYEWKLFLLRKLDDIKTDMMVVNRPSRRKTLKQCMNGRKRKKCIQKKKMRIQM